MKLTLKHILASAAILASMAAIASCSKTKSYSELLGEEEKATNWFLSNRKVANEIPKDGKFITGEDAPFYRMDEDGYLYMQIIDMGDTTAMPKEGDAVYLRYNRYNIKDLYNDQTPTPSGNTGGTTTTAIAFLYGTYDTPINLELGNGVQMPLKYVGYNSEVNLVMRSYLGFQSDQAECLPFFLNVHYFKSEF